MNEVDLKFSAGLDGTLDRGLALIRRSLPRGLMLLGLSTLCWAAVAAAAWIFFLTR